MPASNLNSIIKGKRRYCMKIHENKQLFNEAILAASRPKEEGGLGIKNIFIEKDYWICRSLSLMAKNDYRLFLCMTNIVLTNRMVGKTNHI